MSQDKVDKIQRRAYEIWREAGCPEGLQDAHWSQAEDEIERDANGAGTPADAEAAPAAQPDRAAPAVRREVR